MLKRNRDKLSIVAAILEAAHSGESKTRIMFSANLSFKLLEKYLDICVRSGFVRVNERKYTLTVYGEEFLKQYRQLHDRYYKAQRTLDSLTCERDRMAHLCDESRLLEQLKAHSWSRRRI
jgi:predicted transcriptional regulator